MTLARAHGRGVARTQYLAVVRKEAFQTLRDRRMMFLLVVAPIIQTILFGFAVDFDVDRVPTAVADLDRSPASRDHLRRVLADGTLLGIGAADSRAEADRLIDDDVAAAAILVPPRFGADLAAGRPASVQIVLDGTNPTRASAAGSAAGRYFGEAAQQLARSRAAKAGHDAIPEVQVTPRVLYNPSLKTAVYIVPGILAMLLVIVTTIVTAMGLSREREVGTLEQIMVSPIRPVEFILGKTVPFFLIGLADVALVTVAGVLWFGVPFVGNLLVMLLGASLFLLAALGLGLLLSTLSRTQQQAFALNFFLVNPLFILSGFAFPISAMPKVLQWFTLINPLRYFLVVIRAVFLKGVGLAELWPSLFAMAALAAIMLTLSVLRFRKSLD